MADPSGELTRCPGCGLLLPPGGGPTHAYIGASAACWALFGEVMAREYGEYGYPDIHSLTVDAYAAQHPGIASRRSIQSVALHLVGLYMTVEPGYDHRRAIAERRRLLSRGHTYAWLDPPADMGPLTIAAVHAARDAAEHERRVRAWAASVWAAWAPHHDRIRAWARGQGAGDT